MRKSAFLAQLAHESGQLIYMEELASGQAYEGRLDLGNTQPGDGKRFKGRGPIQLTGRANYRAAGQALGLNLEAQPEMVKTPAVGFRTSVWFWSVNELNDLADAGTLDSFRKITKKINGGTNGQADRENYWAKAKNALGCGSGTTGSGSKCSSKTNFDFSFSCFSLIMYSRRFFRCVHFNLFMYGKISSWSLSW